MDDLQAEISGRDLTTQEFFVIEHGFPGTEEYCFRSVKSPILALAYKKSDPNIKIYRIGPEVTMEELENG